MVRCLAITAILACLSFQCLAASLGCNPPPTGDWILNGSNTTVCDGEAHNLSNVTIILLHNSSLLITKSNVSLKNIALVDNSSLVVADSSIMVKGNISLEANSSFILQGSSILNFTSDSFMSRLGRLGAPHKASSIVIAGNVSLLESGAALETNTSLTRVYTVRIEGGANKSLQACQPETYLLNDTDHIHLDFAGRSCTITLAAANASECRLLVDGREVSLIEKQATSVYGAYVLAEEPMPGSCLISVPGKAVWNSTGDASGIHKVQLTFNQSSANDSFYLMMYGHRLGDANLSSDTPVMLSYNKTPYLQVLSLQPTANYTAHFSLYAWHPFAYNISAMCLDGRCGQSSLALDPEPGQILKKDKAKPAAPKEEIRGVIIEFAGEPMIAEHERLIAEIQRQELMVSQERLLPMQLVRRHKLESLKNGYGRSMELKKASILGQQNSALQMLESQGVPAKLVTHRFKGAINAIALNITTERMQMIENLAGTDNIKAIHPIRKKTVMLNESLKQIGAEEAWGLLDAHSRNITGTGVSIAIIDTGIDYTHPDLGACSPFSIGGTAHDYLLESPHPYPNNYDNTWTVTQGGFEQISLHFTQIDVENGWDFIYIMDENNNLSEIITGQRSDYWSRPIPGDTVKIRLVTDYLITGYGFDIDKITDGTPSMNWSLCGKVVGGYDFVNNDDNPMDDQGHGTHCAAIAAGNGSLPGVAPGASLYGYKVMDSYGAGWEDDIIAGIEAAMDPNGDGNYSDRVDIISLSLGGVGRPDDALSTACSNAVRAGVVVVASAGNSGPDEETIACPGCSPLVITVGATNRAAKAYGPYNTSLRVINDSNANISANAFYNSKNTGAEGQAGQLAYAWNGSAEAFAALNYSGQVALVERGLPFSTLVQNAEQAGCAALIIANNYPGQFAGGLIQESSIPVLAVSQNDGRYLFNMSQVPLTFVNLTVLQKTSMVAEFSSRGPAYIYSKPDVLAPGAEICAARLGTKFADSVCMDSQHVALSGTSMAAPHVAGAAALLKQAQPDWNPHQIKAALKYTASSVAEDTNAQGAGIVNLTAALSLETAVPVAFIETLGGLEYR